MLIQIFEHGNQATMTYPATNKNQTLIALYQIPYCVILNMILLLRHFEQYIHSHNQCFIMNHDSGS